MKYGVVFEWVLGLECLVVTVVSPLHLGLRTRPNIKLTHVDLPLKSALYSSTLERCTVLRQVANTQCVTAGKLSPLLGAHQLAVVDGDQLLLLELSLSLTL